MLLTEDLHRAAITRCKVSRLKRSAQERRPPRLRIEALQGKNQKAARKIKQEKGVSTPHERSFRNPKPKEPEADLHHLGRDNSISHKVRKEEPGHNRRRNEEKALHGDSHMSHHHTDNLIKDLDLELHSEDTRHNSIGDILSHLPPISSKRQPSMQPAEIFPLQHISGLNPLLLAYAPLGVLVASFRMAVWLTLLLIDQAWLTDNNFSIAVLQTLLGVDVRWHNTELVPQDRHVLVSNHITTGDMMMLYKRPNKVIHLISNNVPAKVTQTKNHRIDFQHASVAGYDRLAANKTSRPIHLFPEGGMTNGKAMMKFNRGFMRFSEGLPIVPVALRASLPWNISTHTLTSSFLSNMFWFCFSPYVRLDLTVLPPLKQRLGESKAAFVERIQQKIAAELNIPILDFTLQAKKQMIKERLAGKVQKH